MEGSSGGNAWSSCRWLSEWTKVSLGGQFYLSHVDRVRRTAAVPQLRAREEELPLAPPRIKRLRLSSSSIQVLSNTNPLKALSRFCISNRWTNLKSYRKVQREEVGEPLEGMNSMFSSFDALCAEFLSQKVRASFHSVTSARSSRGGRTSDERQSRRGGFDAEVGSDGENKNSNYQQKTAPRLAPELDGLFCFETLVSHWRPVVIVSEFIGIKDT